MPSEASVMPTWQADRYSLMSSSCVAARGAAPRGPPSASSSSRDAARAHERELGRDEEPVDEDEQRRPATSRSAVTRRRGVDAAATSRRGRRSWHAPDACTRSSASRRWPVAGSVRARRSPRASVEVGLGDAALAVGRQRQADLVPAVDEDVRVVVGLLGAACATAVDEGDRRGEVLELEVADDRRRPRGASRAAGQRRRPRARASLQQRSAISSARCGSSASCPTPPSCCSRSASATRSSPSRTSATTPPRPASCRRSRATCLPAGLVAGEIDAAVRERDRARRGDLRARRASALRDARARPHRHPGAVRGLRGLLRRRRARSPSAMPSRPAGRSRSTRTRSARRSATCARSPRPPARATRRSTSSPASGRGSTRVRLAVRGRRARPPVAALEWLDPVFVAGPLDAAARSSWPAAIDVLGFAGEHSEQTTWEAVRGRAARRRRRACRAATTPRAPLEEARALRRRAARRSGARASSPSTPRPTSRAPARGWSTASSCWPTSCIPTWSPPRSAASSRRSTCSSSPAARGRRRRGRLGRRQRADRPRRRPAATQPGVAEPAAAPAVGALEGDRRRARRRPGRRCARRSRRSGARSESTEVEQDEHADVGLRTG